MSAFLAQYGNLIVFMLLNALLALSMYLPLMGGQLSLASPGFLAIGGYIAAILSTTTWRPAEGPYPVSLLLAEMALAGLVCGILAVVIGLPALRLRGIYLALATIALVEALNLVAQKLTITGGAVGIFNIPQPFSSALGYLWVVAPLALISVVMVYRLERIRAGHALDAIRTDELAASAMGINVTYYKVFAFALGAILAGIVGAINAHVLNTWNPRQGTFDDGVLYLTFVLIGGSRTVAGPILGAFGLTALPEVLRYLTRADSAGTMPAWLSSFLTDGRVIIYGLLIVLGTLFFPQGLVTPSLFRRLRRAPRAAR